MASDIKNGKFEVNVNGSTELEVIINYLSYIKSIGGLMNVNGELMIEVLAISIWRVRQLKGKYKNLQELRDIIGNDRKLPDNLRLKECSKLCKKSICVFTQTLYYLRNNDILDNYNIPNFKNTFLLSLLYFDINKPASITINISLDGGTSK
jgi:hypothetical protein